MSTITDVEEAELKAMQRHAGRQYWRGVLHALFVVALVLLASSSHAAGAAPELMNLKFKDSKLLDFTRMTYGDLLGRNYILSPEVTGEGKTISVDIKGIDKVKLKDTLDQLLLLNGIEVRQLNGYDYLAPRTAAVAAVAPAALVRPDVSIAIPLPSSAAVRVRAPDGAASAPVVAGVSGGSADGLATPIPDVQVYRPLNRSANYLRAALSAFGQPATGPADVVMLTGEQARVDAMLKLLGQVDIRPPVMQVRAALVEFSDGTNSSRNLTSVLNVLGGKLQLSLGAPAVAGGSFLALKTASLDVLFGVMEGDSRFRFRSVPTLRLSDGESARIQVGSDVPVRGIATVNPNTGLGFQSIEMKPTGLLLTVEAQIFRENIRAKIVQELSSVSKTSSSGIDSPTFNKRGTGTVVDAADGELVVLGGLDEDSETSTSSGVPWLPWRLNATKDRSSSQLLLLLEFKRI